MPLHPKYIEPLGAAKRPALGKVEVTLRLPVVAVAIVEAIVRVALQATTIVLGSVAVISLLVLLTRL